MDLFREFEFVLTSAAFYSKSASPEMDEREETLKTITSAVRSWLPQTITIKREEIALKVEHGGRHGGVSPVPWVRVFAPM